MKTQAELKQMVERYRACEAEINKALPKQVAEPKNVYGEAADAIEQLLTRVNFLERSSAGF